MRREAILSSLHKRIRQRTNLVLVALLGGIVCLFQLTMKLPGLGFLTLVLPFGLMFAHMAIAPIPWQWTGSDELRTSLGRGFLQSLLFGLLWVGLAVAGLLLIMDQPEYVIYQRGASTALLSPVDPPPVSPAWGIGLINVVFSTAFGWVVAEKEATEETERRTAELLRQSRSRSLQNQLEPHVLYNALSSLSELVYEDPLAAEEVVARLADLYRMLTVHGKADRISLGQERKLVEAYLAMEQMRLGERLSVEWNWPEGADDIEIPPLFLQPLVENAIKHGISPCDRGGRIVISCIKSTARVYLMVENSGCPLREGAPHGIGLENLESRLALWPGVSGTFSLSKFEQWTIAEIQWLRGVAA